MSSTVYLTSRSLLPEVAVFGQFIVLIFLSKDVLAWYNLFFLVFTDMLFLQGSEAIFKVALSLLGSHKPLILQHDHLETIVDFIKSTLPNLGLVQMEKTISQVWNKLNTWEVCKEMLLLSSLQKNQNSYFKLRTLL